MAALISLRGVTRIYDGASQPALDGIDLDIEAGRITAITGPSGCGKSTLLNLVGGLDRPTRGEVVVDGTRVDRLGEAAAARFRRASVGYVFQFFHLVPRLSAAQNIELPMVLAGIAPEARRGRIARLLADYGLESRAVHRPDELSGGQCQRVAIARAMAMQPGVILADEPTGNLDRHTGQEVMALLEKLHADGGTLAVVTHDPEIGARAARRLRMIDGAIEGDERG